MRQRERKGRTYMKTRRTRRIRGYGLVIALVLISIFLRKQSICWLTVLAAEEKPDRLLSETQDEAKEIAEVEAETWNTKVSENTSEVAVVDIPTAEAVIQEQRTNLPAEIRLEVPVLFQAPELPTGCESVALTMALNYHGFGLEKTTIANDYLIYDNGNFAEGYMGNRTGCGCSTVYI